MPINAGSIRLGHCYATATDQVRKVVEIDRTAVTYVERECGKLTFPTWDRRRRKTTTRKDFAGEVTREIPCDWEGW